MKIEIKKTKKFILAFLCAQVFFGLTAEKSISQTQVNWKWAKQSNCFFEQNLCEDARHHFTDVEIDNLDNSTVVVGEFTGYFSTDNQDVVSNNTAIQGLVAKYDKNGKNVWTNQIATVDPLQGAIANCRGLAIDQYGNIFVTGYVRGIKTSFGFDVQGNEVIVAKSQPHQYNGFVVKYDKNGKVLHVRMDDVKIYNDVVVTPMTLTGGGGDIYLTGAYDYSGVAHLGQFQFQAVTEEQFIMVKLNSNFNVIWATGSYGHSEGSQIEIDVNNNAVYALGLYTHEMAIQPFSLSNQNTNAKFYTRINATTGIPVWLKAIDAKNASYGTNDDMYAEENQYVNGDMTLDNQGNLYIVGTFKGASVKIANTHIVDNNMGVFGNYAFKASGLTGVPIWAKRVVSDQSRGYVFPEALVWYGNQIYVGVKEYINNDGNLTENADQKSFLAFANSGNGFFFHYYEEFNDTKKNIVSAMYLNPQTGGVAIVGDYEGPDLKLGDLAKPELGNTYWILGTIGNEVAPFESRTGAGEGWVARFEKTVVDDGKKPFNAEPTLGGFDIQVVPNPTTADNITFTVNAYADDILNVSLLDVTGTVVYKEQYRVVAGNNSLALNAPRLNAGIYMLRVVGTNFESSNTVVKQ